MNPIVNRRVLYNRIPRSTRNLNPLTIRYIDQIIVLGQPMPDAYHITLYDNFFNTAQTYNSYDNISLLDRFWWFACQNKDNGFIDLINPSTSILASEKTTSGWTQDEGNTCVQDSNYIPSIDGVHYLQDNSCIGVYSRTNSTGVDCVIGAIDSFGVASALFPDITSGTEVAINSITSGVFGRNITNGSLIAKRVGSTTLEYWIDGILIDTKTISSTGIVAVKFSINATNIIGTDTNISNRQIASAFIGSSDINAWYLNYAMEQYMDSLP